MKRKVLIIIICLFCLCGCNNSWKNKFQVSALKIEDNYIVGKMKNLTDKAYDLTITFTLKSGTLKEKEICYELIRPNETINLECLAIDYEDYEVEITNIEFKERTIQKLESGEINEEILNYHFKEIENAHRLNFISFNIDIDEKNYPYISKIEYDEKENKIQISGTIKNGNNSVNYYETYNSLTNKLISLSIFITSDDNDFSSKVLTKVSLMNSLNLSSSNSISLLKTLKRTDIKDGYCVKVGTNWCVSNTISNKNSAYPFEAYFIEQQ